MTKLGFFIVGLVILLSACVVFGIAKIIDIFPTSVETQVTGVDGLDVEEAPLPLSPEIQDDSPVEVALEPPQAEEVSKLEDELEKMKLELSELKVLKETKETIDAAAASLSLDREKFEKRKKALRSGSFTFRNREVPPVPSATQQGASDSQIQVDLPTNSWRWIATEVQSEIFANLGLAIDFPSTEFDLDFVLLAVSSEGVKSFGLTGLFRDGASFRTLADLGFSFSGLTLGFQGLQAGVDAEYLRANSRILSAPFVRASAGVPFSFESVREVPIQRSIIVEGVRETSFEYRPIGLTFNGVVSVVSGQASFSLEIENGTFTESTVEFAPIFQTTSANVRGLLTWGQWSAVAGLKVESETIRKGFLSKRDSDTSELLIVFVRPRLNFPAAIPPPLPPNEYLGLKFSDHLLLPSIDENERFSIPLRALPVPVD